jgi:hypothetical protein
MRCERHRLAAAPDGRCVLCRRTRGGGERSVTRQTDRRIRCVLKVVVGVATFLAAFALLMELFDTRGHREGDRSSVAKQRPGEGALELRHHDE